MFNFVIIYDGVVKYSEQNAKILKKHIKTFANSRLLFFHRKLLCLLAIARVANYDFKQLRFKADFIQHSQSNTSFR